MKIKVLSQETISQIAAGEVIIRPVSVVKELVENSLDAHATNINIVIKEGGKREIKIKDNGDGISYYDVPLAFKRHATSKLSSMEDLNELSTMGFRGEALASIAAVSNVTLITKNKNEELGSKTVLQDGNILSQEIYPVESGSEFIIEDLFLNFPARYKFLKKDKTEENYIRDLIKKISISHPEVSFSYKNNNKLIFKTSGNNDLKQTVSEVFGNNFSKDFFSFEYLNEPLKVYGLMGNLNTRRIGEKTQIFYLNKRLVKDKLMQKVFESVWENKLMPHQLPSGIIFVEIPSSMIDVNVHPQKTEINFLNKSLFTILFKEALNKALENAEIIPEVNKAIKKNTNVEPNKFEIKQSTFNQIKNIPDITPISPSESFNFKEEKKDEIKEKKLDLTNLKFIGTAFNTYLILEGFNSLYLIDQHAAHEALLYELFKKESLKQGFLSQSLLVPTSLNILPEEEELFLEFSDELKHFGFDFNIKNNQVLVKAVPILLSLPQDADLIFDFLAYLKQDLINKPQPAIDKIIQKACKTAIKGGDILNNKEISTLLKELSKLDNPYNCPHGRPVIIKVNKRELEKLFKRIV